MLISETSISFLFVFWFEARNDGMPSGKEKTVFVNAITKIETWKKKTRHLHATAALWWKSAPKLEIKVYAQTVCNKFIIQNQLFQTHDSNIYGQNVGNLWMFIHMFHMCTYMRWIYVLCMKYEHYVIQHKSIMTWFT